MKKITFGIYAEDDANKIFVSNAIPQILAHLKLNDTISLHHELEYTQSMVAKNSEFVVNTYIDRSVIGMRRFDLNICFVCLDCEDRAFEKELKKMKKSIKYHNLDQNIVVSLPVQSIEYWLFYLKMKAENNVSHNDIETQFTRPEMKEMVYGSRKPTNKKSNPIVESISQHIDIEDLISKSISFKAFINCFKNVFQKY
jgi:hypothetical protein